MTNDRPWVYRREDCVVAVEEKKYPKILVNKAQCRKCGDVIVSESRHHLQFCGCGAIYVDGGQEYLRRGGDFNLIEEMSEVERDN